MHKLSFHPTGAWHVEFNIQRSNGGQTIGICVGIYISICVGICECLIFVYICVFAGIGIGISSLIFAIC